MDARTILTKSIDTSPEDVRRMHRQQAGRLIRLCLEHEAELSPAWLRVFQRAAFALWVDGREPR